MTNTFPVGIHEVTIVSYSNGRSKSSKLNYYAIRFSNNYGSIDHRFYDTEGGRRYLKLFLNRFDVAIIEPLQDISINKMLHTLVGRKAKINVLNINGYLSTQNWLPL